MIQKLRTEDCYLTLDAQAAVLEILLTGIQDKDLALSVLEQLWPEDRIYELPEN